MYKNLDEFAKRFNELNQIASEPFNLEIEIKRSDIEVFRLACTHIGLDYVDFEVEDDPSPLTGLLRVSGPIEKCAILAFAACQTVRLEEAIELSL